MRCPSDCYIIMVEEMSSAGYTCPSFLFFSESPNYSKERERELYCTQTWKCKSPPSSSFVQDIHLQLVTELGWFCRSKRSAVITLRYFSINLAPEIPECYSILFYPLHTQSLSESICLLTLFTFKGLNSLFTGLSAICIPNHEKVWPSFVQHGDLSSWPVVVTIM